MTDSEIIQGCIMGSPKAQWLLYKKYKTYLYSACFKYVHNKYEAEDIIQEAMISIFRGIKDFRGDCSFKSWIWIITAKKAINHYNREKRESLYHIAIEDFIPLEKGKFGFEDRFVADDQLEKALKLLQEQAPMQYTNFRLYAIEGMEHKEIAEDLQIAEGTSKSNYFRACEKLRQNLMSFDKMIA